jgi:hypothetical protein
MTFSNRKRRRPIVKRMLGCCLAELFLLAGRMGTTRPLSMVCTTLPPSRAKQVVVVADPETFTFSVETTMSLASSP